MLQGSILVLECQNLSISEKRNYIVMSGGNGEFHIGEMRE